MMTNTQELRRLIKASGFKYQHIANQIGLSAYGLSKKINNETEFKAGEIESLCSVLNIDDVGQRMDIFFAKNVDSKSTNPNS